MRTGEEAPRRENAGTGMDARHMGAKETIVAYILLACMSYITVSTIVGAV